MRPVFAGAPLGGSPVATVSYARPVTGQLPGTVPWSGRDLALALAAVLAFWIAAAALWPLTGTVVPWDSKNHFYPMMRYLGDALANGELPLWNPYHFSGHPAAADPQSLLFTPTMMLFGWLVPRPSMQLFDLVVFAHLLPGALAIVFLFRRRGWHAAGAVAAAMVFVLGGSASARLQHTGIMFGYGLFPLAFWLLEEALERCSYRFALLFAAVAALMVLGRDQVAFLSGLTLLALVGWEAARSGRPLAFLRARLGLFAAMGLLGVLLLLVPVLLTLQFLGTSTRPSFGYGVAAMGSLPPESLATILFPNVFGSLRWSYDYWGPDYTSLTEGTWTDRATNYLFVGTLPALLVLWHGVAGRRLLAREFRFFLALGAVTLVYALGRYTPVFSVIFDGLPGVALYRRPADATFLINVVLAFAGGYLVHRFVMEGAPRLTDIRNSAAAALPSALAVGGVAAAIGAGLAFGIRSGHAAPALLDVAVGLAAATAATVAMRRWNADPAARRVVAAVLVAALGAELIGRNAASALNAEPASRYAVFEQLPPEQAVGLEVLRQELAARHAAGDHPRVEILGLGGGWQNASMMLGLEDTIGYNPLRLAEYEKAIGPGENAVDPNLRSFPGTFRGYKCRLAGLLGLEYLVLDRPLERLPKHFPRITGATQLYGSSGMYIYRLASSAPRAYLATRLMPVDSEGVLQESELPEFDRHTTALVEKDQLDGLQADYGLRDDSPDPAPATGAVTVESYGRNAVSLSVQTDRNAVVVLHDINYPGWEARVDGRPARILRTNLLFRGVEVSPGTHRVEFVFRPFAPGNLLAAARGLVGRDEAGTAQN